MSIDLETAIRKAILEELNQEAERIIEEAKAKIETAIRAHIGRIALGILKQYEISQNQDHIVITVKNNL